MRRRRLLWPVWFALAACGDPDDTTPNGGTETPTTPPGNTTDGPCASTDVLVGTLGTCDDAFPACGGDLSGTWVYVEGCSEPADGTVSTTDEVCDGDVRTETVSRAITLNFEPDGTFQDVVVLDSEIRWTLPPGCIESLGYTQCDQFDPTTVPFECTTEPDGGCTCVSAVDVTFRGEGTWSACEGTLTISAVSGTMTGTVFGSPTSEPSTMDPYEADYCIDSTVMRLGASAEDDLFGFYERP